MGVLDFAPDRKLCMLSKQLTHLLLPFALCAGLTALAAAVPASGSAQARAAFSSIPGWFEAGPRGGFVSRGHSGAVELRAHEIRISLAPGAPEAGRVLPIALPGARNFNWQAEQRLPGVTSYFVGSEPSNWRTAVPQYSRVRAASVWSGVDLAVYGIGRRMEYDFIVAPGADASRIRMHFGRGWRASLAASGDLQVGDGVVSFRQARPVAWQQRDGQRVEIAAHFRMLGDGNVGFELAPYDRSQTLVIDPVLAFSDFIGGSVTDTVTAVAAAKDGYWLAGSTGSDVTTVSTTTPFATARKQNLDVFLAKIKVDANGAPFLAYYTFIGGAANETPNAIAVFPDGSLAVVGVTASSAFPTTASAFQTTLGGVYDAFVLKYDPSLSGTSALAYSSFFGGTTTDSATGVAIDSKGNIVVAGWTQMSTLTTASTNPGFQSNSGGGIDAFILKVNPAASGSASLVYSTLYGGNLTDSPAAVAVDASDRIYITGSTTSATLPLAGSPFQTFLHGYQDAFLAVIDPSKSGLQQVVYATFFGGESLDAATDLAIDAKGGVWLTGYTISQGFPVTAGALQLGLHGQAAAWLAHVDIAKTGSAFLTYSTYFNGTVGATIPYALVLDGQGRPTIAGYTTSVNLPLAG